MPKGGKTFVLLKHFTCLFNKTNASSHPRPSTLLPEDVADWSTGGS